MMQLRLLHAWKAVEHISPGWDVQISGPDNEGAIEKKGEPGRAWMAEEFSWRKMAETMLATYEWIHQGQPTHEWVKMQ